MRFLGAWTAPSRRCPPDHDSKSRHRTSAVIAPRQRGHGERKRRDRPPARNATRLHAAAPPQAEYTSRATCACTASRAASSSLAVCR
ncbi:hypothetical protein [Lysobacter gummosus]|uniref:hypothetical protein n=1 Tax=Lysobacter gummosus TaxID=262324 RepID=UPI0036337EA0